MKKLVNDLVLIMRGIKEIHNIRSGLFLLIVFRSFFFAFSPFVNIYMSARIVNDITAKKSFVHLLLLVVITVLANFLIALVSSALNHIINVRRLEFNALYQMNKSRKIMRMEYSVAEDSETHFLEQKLIESANLNNGGIPGLLSAIQNLVQPFFTVLFSISLTISLFFTPQLTRSSFISFVTSPFMSVIVLIIILINVFIGMYSQSAMEKKMNYLMLNNAVQANMLGAYYAKNYLINYHTGKDVRIYDQQNLIRAENVSVCDECTLLAKKLSRNQIKHTMLTTISTTLLTYIVYLYIGIKALLGIFGVGEIIQYIGSITQFAAGATGFIAQLAVLRTNNEILKLYFELMDMPEDSNQGTRPINKSNIDEYEIEFKDVSFKYPNTSNYVLKHLNLKLNTKKSLAVVGMNGSGKTTMVKLLLRLYTPTEGVITLNGIDINEYQYNDYINIFGVVFQDFQLFSFSLGQNVAANMSYDSSKVEECLKEVGLYDRLVAMPNGLDTYLYKDFEKDGVEISGGEAQKIALARALYKNAPFIVLDEPTAALDPIAEYEIYSNFNTIMDGKNAIYISHRLSSCRFCDNIAVFQDGELIQYGSHDSLITEKDGKYYELWNAQAQYYNK